MSGKGTEATRRWRQRNPDKAKDKDRRAAARRLAAEGEFVKAHRDRYDELMAASLPDGDSWDNRRRAAIKVVRTEYPDDWAHQLRVQREAEKR